MPTLRARLPSTAVALAALALATGCTTVEVVSIDDRVAPSWPDALPLPLTVGVEPLALEPDAFGDARDWQRRLPQVLRERDVFRRVLDDARDPDAQLRISGRVGGRFEPAGLGNFLTWIPGPFIYMQAWRGSVFVYDAQTQLEVREACSGEVVTTLDVATRHEFSFRSGNPGYVFGALIIVPGVIRGVMAQEPREEYRRQTYERAYADLWSRVAAELANDPALWGWGGESTRLCDN